MSGRAMSFYRRKCRVNVVLLITSSRISLILGPYTYFKPARQAVKPAQERRSSGETFTHLPDISISGNCQSEASDFG